MQVTQAKAKRDRQMDRQIDVEKNYRLCDALPC